MQLPIKLVPAKCGSFGRYRKLCDTAGSGSPDYGTIDWKNETRRSHIDGEERMQSIFLHSEWRNSYFEGTLGKGTTHSSNHDRIKCNHCLVRNQKRKEHQFHQKFRDIVSLGHSCVGAYSFSVQVSSSTTNVWFSRNSAKYLPKRVPELSILTTSLIELWGRSCNQTLSYTAMKPLYGAPSKGWRVMHLANRNVNRKKLFLSKCNLNWRNRTVIELHQRYWWEQKVWGLANRTRYYPSVWRHVARQFVSIKLTIKKKDTSAEEWYLWSRPHIQSTHDSLTENFSNWKIFAPKVRNKFINKYWLRLQICSNIKLSFPKVLNALVWWKY